MDMLSPKMVAEARAAASRETLARLAQALGCAPESFFDAAHTDKPRDTSQLIQMWLAIRNPNNREVVWAFVNEILQTEKQSPR